MNHLSLVLPAVGLVLAMVGVLDSSVAAAPGELKYRVVAPQLSRAELPPTPTPTPRPVPYTGPVASLFLASAKVSSQWPVEIRDTTLEGGRETFENPSQPERIAWYSRFGQPGYPANNSLFAGHINYVCFGNGPFAFLTSAVKDDALYVTMDNGVSYTYTVKSVEVISLTDLQNGAMDAYVFPPLDSYTERVTLISCGGDFVPAPGGGGDYTSRVILVAERYVN
jgi:hypothetical protein